MSFGGFWKDVADKAKNGVVGAFDAARAGLSSPIGQFAQAAFMPQQSFVNNTDIGQSISSVTQAPIVWAGNQASHAIATPFALYDQAEAANRGSLQRFGDLLHGETWKRAWTATQDTSGGTVLAYLGKQYATNGFGDVPVVGDQRTITNQMVDPATGQVNETTRTTSLAPEIDKWQNTTQGRIAGGVADVVATWYADPTILIGGAAKLSRAANIVQDSAKADEVTKAFDAKNLAANPEKRSALKRGKSFTNTADETATRFSGLIASSDNMGVNEVAAHYAPILERHPDTAPIIDLIGQAGKIEDLTKQRQVKADILLAAMDSPIAQQRLVEHAPELARAMQRASFAPEEFAVFDKLAANSDQLYRNGGSITDAAVALATPGNEAEVKAFGQRLDQIHRHMRDITIAAQDGGGLEYAAMNSLQKVKADYKLNTARDFFYQDAASGRTVRIMHWALGQRFRGVVATDDAARGHLEMMDHLKRSGLYSGAERAQWSQRWFAANGQGLRNKVVDDLWDNMLQKVADKYSMSRDQLDRLTQEMKFRRGEASAYTTALMEQGRAEGLSRVTIEDPASGMPTSIDRALYESHLRNNVALPPTDLLERAVRHAMNRGTASDKVAQAEERLLGASTWANDVWRLAVLARPGLFFRTQLDTQLRVAATIGATNVMKNALVGMGHSLNKRLTRDELIQSAMRAEDELLHEQHLADAAELRRQAGFLSGDAADRLHQRAAEAERKASEIKGRLDNPNYLGTKAKQVKVVGQKVTMDPAYDSDANRIATWNRLLPGEATVGDAMLVLGDKLKAKFVEAGGHRTHMPDDLEWAGGYVRGIDPMLGSHGGRAILENLDLPTPDLIAKVRNDPRVRKTWLAVMFDNETKFVNGQRHSGYLEWLDRAVANAKYLVPNEQVRQRLLAGDRLTPAEVEKMFKPRGAFSAEQLASMRVPHETGLTKAEKALADFEQNTPIRTKAHAEMRDSLRQKVEDARAKLEEFDSKYPQSVVSDLPDRMPVEGPMFSMFDGPGSQYALSNPILNIGKKALRLFSDLPDTMLGRHPMYVSRYERRWKALAAREVMRNGKLSTEASAKIHKIAKHRAIMDVQQTLYDTARYTGAHHGVMRIVSPFLNAWEDAMVSWGRLMYDDPKVLGGLIKTWNVPERMGMITDRNGNVVRPGEKADQKFITIPLPGALSRWAGVKEIRLRKDSLNSVFQGEVPWMPGFGPMVAVPAQQFMARSFPEFSDSSKLPEPASTIMRSLMNGDAAPKYHAGPKGLVRDVVVGSLPAWWTKLADAFDPTSPAFTNVVQDSINSQVIKARQTGRPIDIEKFAANATRAARNTTLIRGMALGLFGQSVEGAGAADFYRNQYRLIQNRSKELHDQGTTVEQEFNRLFPEAAGLRFSVSVNNTGIQAYAKTENRASKYKKQIEANPEYGWFYVGSDNLASGDEFSAAIYNAQSSRRLNPLTSKTQRERVDADTMAKETEKQLGWTQYQKVLTRLDLLAEQYGASDLNDIPQLKEVKDQFVTAMRQQYPVWAEDFDNFDTGALDRFVTNVAKPALDDPSLKNRSDIQMLGKYLDLRDRVNAIAAQRGVTLAAQQDSADLRKFLYDTGAQMARQDLGFEQVWQRMLSREVEPK